MTAWGDAQYDNVFAPGVEHHWWHLARGHIIRQVIDSLGASTILDVGCGPGVMVGYLRQRGYDCWGCDLGSPSVAPAAEGAVWTGTDALQLDEAFRHKVGVILLLDVIEHLPDPAGFLGLLQKAFPNVTAIVVAVPARRELWSVLDEYFGHQRRYDRAMITQQFAAAGLAVARQRYVFHSLYPLMLLLRRQRKPSNAIRIPSGPSLFHNLAASWFGFEARLPLGRLFGSSLVAVGVPRAKAKSQGLPKA